IYSRKRRQDHIQSVLSNVNGDYDASMFMPGTNDYSRLIDKSLNKTVYLVCCDVQANQLYAFDNVDELTRIFRNAFKLFNANYLLIHSNNTTNFILAMHTLATSSKFSGFPTHYDDISIEDVRKTCKQLLQSEFCNM